MRNDLGGRKKITVNSKNIIPIGCVKQLDDVTLKLDLQTKSGGNFDVTGQTLSLRCRKSNNKTEELSNTSTDTPITFDKNEVDIKLRNSMFNTVGVVKFELNIQDSTGAMTTASFFITVVALELDDDAVTSSEQYSVLQEIINNFDSSPIGEVVAARNGHATLGERLDVFGSQLDKNVQQLTNKINEVATTGTTTEVLQTTTETYIQKKIDDGTIANMTIEDGALTYEKFGDTAINKLQELCLDTIVEKKNLFSKAEILENKQVTSTGVVDNTGTKVIKVILKRHNLYMLYNIYGQICIKNSSGTIISNTNYSTDNFSAVPILLNGSEESTATLYANYDETVNNQSIYKVNDYKNDCINPELETLIKNTTKERTNNLFDKDRVFYDVTIENSSASITGYDAIGKWIGNIVEVSPTDVIYSNKTVRLLFFDSSMNAIKKKTVSAGGNYDLTDITEGTVAYMLIGSDGVVTDANAVIISKSPITEYEPYYKIPVTKVNEYNINDYKNSLNDYDGALTYILNEINSNKANDNSGATIIFPEGTFELSPFILPARTKLVGQGIGVTVLKAKNGTSGDLIRLNEYSKFTELKGFVLFGNKENADVNGIVLNQDTTPTHDYTEVYNKNNVDSTTYFYTKIEDVLVVDCAKNGIDIGFRFYLCYLNNVYTYGCNGYGIINKSTDNFFSNIVAERSGLSGIYELGANNKWSNVKSIWNGKITVDGEAGIKIKDTMRVQMSNVECQDNYCNGYHLENVQAIMISNGLADGNGRILDQVNTEGFCGNENCMGLYMKGVTASKIDMHFDNYKNPVKYQNKAYYIDGYGTYDNQYNFTERRQNVPMVLPQQYSQFISCYEANIPYPADMYRGKTLLYYSETEGRDKVCICVKKNSTEYEWKEI